LCRRFHLFGFCTLFNRFTFAMDDDFDLRYKVNGQADVGSELAKIADWLHIDLLFLDFETRLFLNGDCHILRGDGAIQLAGFSGAGAGRVA